MKKLFLLALVATALISCRTKPTTDSLTTSYDAFAEKIGQLNLTAGNFEDITAMMELSGADYMPDIANDPFINEQYLVNEVMAAANLGVYMADGLYRLAFDEFNDGSLSLKAAKNIADKLKLGSAFDDFVFDRYNDTAVYADSMLYKVKQAISESQVILTDADRMQVFAAIVSGNYIEKLHILFSQIFKYNVDLPEESKLLILRQTILVTDALLKKLPDVISLVESVKKESDPGIILARLKEIEALRLQLKFADEPGKLTPDLIFKNQGLIDVYNKIEEVRALIVSVPQQ
jgi:hypothetical protein